MMMYGPANIKFKCRCSHFWYRGMSVYVMYKCLNFRSHHTFRIKTISYYIMSSYSAVYCYVILLCLENFMFIEPAIWYVMDICINSHTVSVLLLPSLLLLYVFWWGGIKLCVTLRKNIYWECFRAGCWGVFRCWNEEVIKGLWNLLDQDHHSL
jgi:hypothetical protein